LGVISSSPGELEPVFSAMLENAVRICGAKFGNLWLREGHTFRIWAPHGAPAKYMECLRRQPLVTPDPRMGMGQIVRSKAAIHVADIRGEPAYADNLRIATIELADAARSTNT
jgi:two-component system, NtrC family, sensor kinase